MSSRDEDVLSTGLLGIEDCGHSKLAWVPGMLRLGALSLGHKAQFL